MRPPVIVATVVALLAGGVGAWFWLHPATADVGANRKAVTVRRGSISVKVSAPGQVVPAHQATVYTKGGGIVREILVKPGASVQAGQLLIRLDSSALEAQIAAQDAQIASLTATLDGLQVARNPDQTLARSAVAQAQLAADAARLQLTRSEADLKLGAIPAQVRDQAQTALEQANLALESARQRATQSDQASTQAIKNANAQLKAARLQRRALEAQRASNEIRAPLVGTLVDLTVAVGQAVGADAALAQVADLTSWTVESRVSENDLPNLRLGMGVKATVEALLGDALEAKVIRVGQVKKFKDPIYYYQVDSRLNAGDTKLTPGLATTAEFVTQQLKNVPIVPLSALQSVGDKTMVEVRVGAQVKMLEVHTDLDDGTNIAVTSGLEPGAVVLLPRSPNGPSEVPPDGIGKAVGF